LILAYYCQNFQLKKSRPSFIPGILWLVLVTILLLLPGSAFPQNNWFGKIWFDKWVHIGLFAVMVACWCWALLRYPFNRTQLINAFIAMAICWLAYGIGMEFVQKYFVVNRSFDIGDIVADGIRCLAGWLFSKLRYIKK